MTATVHLLCGSTGAGKTTYGRVLADEIGGVLFTVDEWMTALFWMDAPQPIERAWAIVRLDRCVTLIWRTATALARCGTPPILEIGLTTRIARARIAAWAARDGVRLKLHYLDVPAEERWSRVEGRNQQPGSQLAFQITRDHFDFVEAMWEPPSTEELATYDSERSRKT